MRFIWQCSLVPGKGKHVFGAGHNSSGKYSKNITRFSQTESWLSLTVTLFHFRHYIALIGWSYTNRTKVRTFSADTHLIPLWMNTGQGVQDSIQKSYKCLFQQIWFTMSILQFPRSSQIWISWRTGPGTDHNCSSTGRALHNLQLMMSTLVTVNGRITMDLYFHLDYVNKCMQSHRVNMEDEWSCWLLPGNGKWMTRLQTQSVSTASKQTFIAI